MIENDNGFVVVLILLLFQINYSWSNLNNYEIAFAPILFIQILWELS